MLILSKIQFQTGEANNGNFWKEERMYFPKTIFMIHKKIHRRKPTEKYVV